MEIRLNKYIALCGEASRRQADQLIQEGKVTVNKSLGSLGTKVDPEKDIVKVNGKTIKLEKHYEYVMLNKPKAVLSTSSDPHGRKTVLDLVRSQNRLFPVGRLDYNSRGLILLTNDGELANRLTHPRYKHPKTYLVKTREDISVEKLRKLKEGIYLEDSKTLPSKIRRISPNSFQMTLYQGLNRQIRRMCKSLDLTVIDLVRSSVGPLYIGSLQPGSYRRLREDEVEKLKKLVS